MLKWIKNGNYALKKLIIDMKFYIKAQFGHIQHYYHMAVPFNGNQAWIHNLKLEIEKPWRQWRAYEDTDNVSGYVVDYKGLTFCTIKGTGHMAPQWKPKEAYYMFSKFLNGENL